jgi:hypothetical protein
MFVADMVTLAWVGMWRGLNSRRPNRAAAAAMARVLVLPWVAWLVTVLLFAVSARGGGGDWWDGKFLVLLWLMLGIAANLLFGLPARLRLLSEFRKVATTRFETRSGRK